MQNRQTDYLIQLWWCVIQRLRQRNFGYRAMKNIAAPDEPFTERSINKAAILRF